MKDVNGPYEKLLSFTDFVHKFKSSDLDPRLGGRDWQLFFAMRDICWLMYSRKFEGYYEPGSFGYITDDAEKITHIDPAPFKNSTLIPWQDNPKAIELIPDVLRKTLLYSDLTVFVLPYELNSSYISYSGGLRDLDISVVERILTLNEQLLNLLDDSQAIFLPQLFRHEASSTSDFSVTRAEAPYLQDMYTFNYLPLNNSRRFSQVLKEVEDSLVYKNVILPYFPSIPVSELVKIKKNETEAFERFKYTLRRKLAELKKVETAERMTDIFEEIDYEIQGLIVESKKLLNMRIMQGVNIGFCGISLMALLMPSLNIPKEFVGIVGPVSVLNLIKEQLSYIDKKLEMKKNDFYIPYLFYKKEK
ncbi:MAG: hypothetical protein HY862_02825 [Chloroflexi bacterium]|nr:hypothetical protein [Chloroflexota bacterium]